VKKELGCLGVEIDSFWPITGSLRAELGKAGTTSDRRRSARADQEQAEKKKTSVLIPWDAPRTTASTRERAGHVHGDSNREGSGRYTAKQGRRNQPGPAAVNYGGHPSHILGMPGTVVMPEKWFGKP